MDLVLFRKEYTVQPKVLLFGLIIKYQIHTGRDILYKNLWRNACVFRFFEYFCLKHETGSGVELSAEIPLWARKGDAMILMILLRHVINLFDSFLLTVVN